MMTAHSNLGASSAYRWMNCPASVGLIGKAPPPAESEYAKEGTIAHELAAYSLKNGYADAAHAVDSVPGATPEMALHVNMYLGAVYAALKEAGEAGGGALYVETRFTIDVAPGMFGTCDAVVVCPSLRKKWVFDFKYGAGVTVKVEGNPQLQYYALGSCQDGATEHVKTREIEIVIVQPRGRGDPIKRVVIDRVDLIDFRQTLIDAVARTKAPNPEVRSGAWCFFCPAKIICPALRESAEAAAREAFAEPAPAAITPEQLGAMLTMARNAETWAEAVRQYALTEARCGRTPAGYSLNKLRSGALSWRKGVTAAHVQSATGGDVQVLALRTPADMRKEMGAGFSALAPLTEQQPDVMGLKRVKD